MVQVFQPEEVSFDLKNPRYNIAPTQIIPVVAVCEDKKRLLASQWGFVPGWAQDPLIGSRMINARAETLAIKPAFKSSFLHNRCLIPADGFYEWHTTGKDKQAFYIHAEDDDTFAFAGLYSVWNGAATGPLTSCTIVTTAADSLMSPIHDRMPVILPESKWDAWLDPGETREEIIQRILQTPHGRQMRMYMVSMLVNSPTNDTEQCIAEYHPGPAKDLFT